MYLKLDQEWNFLFNALILLTVAVTLTLNATTAIASVTLHVIADLAADLAQEAMNAGEEIRAATLRAITVVAMTETTAGALLSVAAEAHVVVIAMSDVTIVAVATMTTVAIIDVSKATKGVKTGAMNVVKSAVALTQIAVDSALLKTVIVALLARREADLAHVIQVSNN